VKYAFMRNHRGEFRLRPMCRVLQVSASGYYDWLRRRPSRRTQEDRQWLDHIRRIHLKSRESYGTLRVWNALRSENLSCGKHRVARLRRLYGIQARRRRRFCVTTHSKHQNWIAPDRVQRHFTVAAPNRVWVGDVTFIATRSGWLYLAVLLDLYSRKIVGWSMSERNNVALVQAALTMALEHRRPAPGLIHHTDRGRLYAGDDYRQLMAQHGLIPSMSRHKDCWDNAVAESFFATLKNELLWGRDYHTRDQARQDIFEYIEVFYNRQRSHQTLGYRSPVAFETTAAVA
jgi:transposase InsO family protein